MTSTFPRTQHRRRTSTVTAPPSDDHIELDADTALTTAPVEVDLEVIDLREGRPPVPRTIEDPDVATVADPATDEPDDEPDVALRPMAANAEVAPGRVSAAMHILLMAATCAVITWHVAIRGGTLGTGRITIVYSLVVTAYVLSRFMLAAAYRPPKYAGLEPSDGFQWSPEGAHLAFRTQDGGVFVRDLVRGTTVEVDGGERCGLGGWSPAPPGSVPPRSPARGTVRSAPTPSSAGGAAR